MVTSVHNQGLAGMQASQREIVKAAGDIARVAGNVRGNDDTAPAQPQGNDVVTSLLEMRRQEHVFNASAKVVSVADQTLGSLIDVTA